MQISLLFDLVIIIKLILKTTTLYLYFFCSILIPLFDPDTSMLFLAGKGDTTISYMEVSDRYAKLLLKIFKDSCDILF